MKKEIEHRFTYHKPNSVEEIKKYELIREECKNVALLFHDICPSSRELSIAFTKLDEVVFWANASIARNREE